MTNNFKNLKNNIFFEEILVAFLFIVVASVSYFYVKTLPSTMPQDEYVVLLTNKAVADQTFPESEMLIRYNYANYLYFPIIRMLTNNFDIENYRSFLLFMYVFLTGYAAYLALRMIRISRIPVLITAIVALLPRISIGSTFFGVFTNKENLGRSMAFPLIWLVSAWHIRRLHDGRTLWPVFLVLGLVSYIHPVSFLFLAGLFLLVTIIYLFWERRWKYGLQQFFLGLAAFIIGAAPLLWEVLTRTKGIATGITTAVEYAEAIHFRLGWEFPPGNLVWLKAVSVVSIFFIAFIYFVWRMKKKQGWSVDSKTINIVRWSTMVSAIAVFLSILLPAMQLYLIQHFNAPLLVQQTSRFFIFYYLGLFTAFAAALDLFWNNFLSKKKWGILAIVGILLGGMISSNIGSEWLQFLTGRGQYDPGYIPISLQKESAVKSDFLVYPEICQALKDSGATSTSKIMTDDGLRLLYFCKIPLYTTWQEGGAYLNQGRKPFVDWYKRYMVQSDAIDSADVGKFVSFAKNVKAQFAVLYANSPMVKELVKAKYAVTMIDGRAVIRLSK